MYQIKEKLFYSRDDQCNDCSNKNRCPLIEALIYQMVCIIPEEMATKNCGMYQKNNLKVINKEPINNLKVIGEFIKEKQEKEEKQEKLKDKYELT